LFDLFLLYYPLGTYGQFFHYEKNELKINYAFLPQNLSFLISLIQLEISTGVNMSKSYINKIAMGLGFQRHAVKFNHLPGLFMKLTPRPTVHLFLNAGIRKRHFTTHQFPLFFGVEDFVGRINHFRDYEKCIGEESLKNCLKDNMKIARAVLLAEEWEPVPGMSQCGDFVFRIADDIDVVVEINKVIRKSTSNNPHSKPSPMQGKKVSEQAYKYADLWCTYGTGSFSTVLAATFTEEDGLKVIQHAEYFDEINFLMIQKY
jgi:hypothetical protein